MKISSGSYDLNKWLCGGYECDVISVIYGSSGSGKTNLCLSASVSQAKKGNKVLFVDTEGGFSSERVKQMAGEESEKVLGNIFVLSPTNFSEQKDAFEKLLEHIKKEGQKIGLIVVDGMTILYRLDFADAKGKDGEFQKVNSELVRQMRTLSEISRKQNIPILVTGQVYNWENSSKLVGGDILKYWGKCWIELVNENGKRTVFLRKHRSLPEKSLGFQIVESGIKKRGWI
ncbi:DNA repair and recombination protein RadB [Candidatus Pacearchaeota archaeon CG10_big_fil_rev_8_21_14_0_10_31_24]|nr:MAG: DNA repair and recombination protein RadB [Candidatus Pacearchaeota archaeon CG10_big_fil_rev_8_21_14_0_10_31_24]